MMDEYRAFDVTEKAKAIAKGGSSPAGQSFGTLSKRRLLLKGLAAEGKTNARSLRCIQYGETEVELSCIEQLVEISQARAIMDCLQKLADGDLLRGDRPLSEVLLELEKMICADGKEVGTQGLDCLSRFREPCPFTPCPDGWKSLQL